MELELTSLEETKQLAERIAKDIKVGDVIALYGDLGSGKTTFTKFLVEALGFDVRVQSPTFVVARKYSKSNGTLSTINHVDLYRMTKEEEVDDIGLEELFTEPDSITILEWPELAEDKLSSRTVKIKFTLLNEGRKANVQNLH